MNYSAMIQNRRSVHAFREKEVPSEAIGQLRSYYEKTCPRLVPEIATELIVLDKDAQPALESSAGYKQFLIGAPHYLLLMSAPHSYAGINAGYMMEDLVLKLTELDIDTCWMTFTDSDKIKQALSLATGRCRNALSRAQWSDCKWVCHLGQSVAVRLRLFSFPTPPKRLPSEHGLHLRFLSRTFQSGRKWPADCPASARYSKY